MSRLARPLPARTRRQIVEQVAPRYREASFAQKILLLDAVVEASGYTRKYAITLLNQSTERPPTIQQHSPLASARSEVLQALFFAWNVANWICAKRLIPFLPTLIDALERHGHLNLSEAAPIKAKIEQASSLSKRFDQVMCLLDDLEKYLNQCDHKNLRDLIEPVRAICIKCETSPTSIGYAGVQANRHTSIGNSSV